MGEDQTTQSAEIFELISTQVIDKYEVANSTRTEHVELVLTSQSLKKIVVAGPGTGKTHLFKQVLKGKKKTLTLTFVNSLVEDLCLELNGMSEVKTLHGFARSIIAKAKKSEVNIFPKLSTIVKEDAKILLNKEIDFDELFNNLTESEDDVDFYKGRKTYYDNFYGYTDVVYAVVKYFQQHPESIPSYEQIVVDEFQDFNLLEVSLIDLLAQKSPVLIAGDDDQALYEFKGASSQHIRHKYGDGDPDFAAFNLPFCSRCTRVIVDATNDIIESAKNNGFLSGRIDKPYTYFDNVDKDKVSDSNPAIVYTKVFWKQIPWFIETQIEKIAEELKNKFSVLVISPTKTQSSYIAKSLSGKGFKSVEFSDKKDGKEATLLDGLKILLDNPHSNLGWRIAIKSFLSEDNFQILLNKTFQEGSVAVDKIAQKNHKAIYEQIKGMSKILKDTLTGAIEPEVHLPIFKQVGFDTNAILSETIKEELGNETQHLSNPGLRKIPIKTTTIQSSKGLSEDYVFITHFDDQYFLKDGSVTDQCICNLLVALTRARKKVFLISTQDNPAFLEWIKPERIERV